MTVKKTLVLSRPKDKSFEAYKKWIMSMTAQLTGMPEKDDLPEEGWLQDWQQFWNISTSKRK